MPTPDASPLPPPGAGYGLPTTTLQPAGSPSPTLRARSAAKSNAEATAGAAPKRELKESVRARGRLAVATTPGLSGAAAASTRAESRSRSRSNDGGALGSDALGGLARPFARSPVPPDHAAEAGGRLRPADFSNSQSYAAASGLDILNKVRNIMSEVEDLKGQLGEQLQQTESVISQHDDTMLLGPIALQTQLRSQLAQLDEVIYMSNEVHEMAVDLIGLG